MGFLINAGTLGFVHDEIIAVAVLSRKLMEKGFFSDYKFSLVVEPLG